MERKYARFNFTDHFHEHHVMKDLQGWIHSEKPMPVHLIVDKRRGRFGAFDVLIPKYSKTERHSRAQMLDALVVYTSPDYNSKLHAQGEYLWVSESKIKYITGFDTNTEARHLLSLNPNDSN